MIHLITTVEAARVDWLKQFIQHYKSLGVQNFHITIQFEETVVLSEICKTKDYAKKILKPFGINDVLDLICPFDAMRLRTHHDNIQNAFVKPDEWIVWADIDEFQMHQKDLNIQAKEFDKAGINICGGFLVDRIARSGKLVNFEPTKPIWSQFPIGASITRDIVQGQIHKVTMSRNTVKIKYANHDPLKGQKNLRWAPQRNPVFHFKWDISVMERLKIRLTESWKQRCPWWVQTERLFQHIYNNNGCINLEYVNSFDFEDDKVEDFKVPYRVSPFYKNKWEKFLPAMMADR